ncbi:hypothetical protein [Fontivita pretiosa]|uniref:hypothetical protein n=1 Tax=Fontivita pretiosa TaxID=2989684 RepID=UPI003D170DDE
MAVIAAVNDEQILAANLARSPMLQDGTIRLIVERGHAGAASAYNAGLARSVVDVAIFAHQDVYFPRGWQDKLNDAIDSLEEAGHRWAVLGVWGIRHDGRFAGHVWCSGGNREYHVRVDGPTEVASIDEVVIVLNCATGLRFDQRLPGFHLYATDLACTARQRGLGTFVFDAPVVHNSHWDPQLDVGYFRAYRFMARKWAAQLPLLTCVLPVERVPWRLYQRWIKFELIRLCGRIRSFPRHPDPRLLARALRYEPELD